ncbi:Zn(II)2Cys6 transcription factor domain-containing protein [Aspergillus aculeatinus CBS 121060]|uniref:Sugar transporter n=1 Tax=Aspergillus aculeatinus CBS 121060 TaxID=1448322 RepID=A0ACD1GXQ5_9EURO|nr:sugar transporter [Aspergillus aculeatinus CBS 121060]RAH66097.1 sugar transporter [Aspergillus aculeatinus CBS 121060]
MKAENTKAGNQAWRKKPRKFAPKSRLGCKTCKIRRIKCDLARPACLKCYSTGRTCDGYSGMTFTSKLEKAETETTPHHKEIVGRADICNNYHPRTTISAYESARWHSKYHGLNSQDFQPFMILPVTASTEAEIMSFFRDVSIKHLNEYRPCESWRQTLMFFAQTVPAVRHAAIALALIHRNYYLDCHSNNGFQYQPPLLKDRLPDHAPLLHYNCAIQLLLSTEKRDSTGTIAVTLMICYLFTCLDHLGGDNVQAVKHLRGGVALSRSIINNATFSCYIDDDAPSWGNDVIIDQVTQQIRRLDMQAVMFLVDWTPADLQETFTMSHLALSDNSPFQSLDQAADHLQMLVTQVMRLRNTDHQISPTGTMPPLPSSLNYTVRGQLETWSRRFEALLLQPGSSSSSPSAPASQTNPLVTLLRLQHTIARVLLEGYGPGREMDYDKFLPQFQQCIALAGEVAAAHHRYVGSSARATFTPEIGLIPVLFIVGVKCRHPVVRRRVLEILRRQPMREAAWDSILTARVVERVIEIEEGGGGGVAGQEQMAPRCIEQILLWQRIEALSYTYIPRGRASAARLEIEYTFCAREGIHVESLTI